MRSRITALRSFAWRIGVGAPKLETVRAHVGRVAANLDARGPAEAAARALGLPGLYRSPACWGGDAPFPERGGPSNLVEWAARCQAASFEIAVELGPAALAFVKENAFGPFEALHGLGLRALFRLSAEGAVDPETLDAAIDRLENLDPDAREAALDGLGRPPVRVAAPDPGVRQRIAEGLERIANRAKNVRTRLVMIDPLARLDPDRARRFLPDLRRLLRKDETHALDAALLVRALEPRDTEARDVLRRFANEHPDPKVRLALETRLRPPQRVPGGKA